MMSAARHTPGRTRRGIQIDGPCSTARRLPRLSGQSALSHARTGSPLLRLPIPMTFPDCRPAQCLLAGAR